MKRILIALSITVAVLTVLALVGLLIAGQACANFVGGHH